MYILFTLIALHFLCDYPLQGEFIARWKNRNQYSKLVIGIPWYHLMTAHSFIHGGAVALATGELSLGIIEVFSHFIIDVLKCERYTDIHVDQTLHIGLKIGYVMWLGEF